MSTMNMPPTDENVNAIIAKIVAELQGSMLQMHLQKAAWVSYEIYSIVKEYDSGTPLNLTL